MSKIKTNPKRKTSAHPRFKVGFADHRPAGSKLARKAARHQVAVMRGVSSFAGR